MCECPPRPAPSRPFVSARSLPALVPPSVDIPLDLDKLVRTCFQVVVASRSLALSEEERVAETNRLREKIDALKLEASRQVPYKTHTNTSFYVVS